MKRGASAVAAALCLAAWAGVAVPAQAQSLPGPAHAGEQVVLRVTLNSEVKDDLFVQRVSNGDFLLRAADLKAIGFKNPAGSTVVIDGQRYVSLHSLSGVRFDFDEDQLALKITADPKLLQTQKVDLFRRARLPMDATPARSSGFLNYALTTTNIGARPGRPGLSGEFGWRLGDYVFDTNAESLVVDDVSGRRKLVRLMTSVTRDDPQQLRRTVAGDFFSPTRELSPGVNLGGLSVSKLYSLDPTFVQFPMQSVSGTVALPSQLEVYVDGQRVRTDQIKPGGFQVNDILAYAGARDVQVLVRDPFGRVQQLTYSFYFSDQALRRGLQEYSYNIGALRRNYGNESEHYGPGAFSIYHRYGLTDSITLGMHAEGTRTLRNGGPTATLVLGAAGVLNVAAAASAFNGQHGGAAVGSYTYASNTWGIGASLRHDWGHYAALADPITVSNRNYEATASATYRLGRRGSISLSQAVFRVRTDVSAPPTQAPQEFAILQAQNHRATTLAYSLPVVPGWATLTASASHVHDQLRGSYNEAFVALTLFLGKGYSAAASYRRDPAYGNQSVQFLKQQPLGEGLGFVVGADRSTDPAGNVLRASGSMQYNAPIAVFRADADRNRDVQGTAHDEFQLSVAGGIAFLGGAVAVGRPITGSYGIVNTGGLSGIGVQLNGQPMGKTNADGKLFLPNLSPYMVNDVSLVPDTVPIEYSVGSLRKRFVPSIRSGSAIDFPMRPLRAFTGKLVGAGAAAGVPLEYAQVRLEDGAETEEYQTGDGGEFYFENLKPGRYHGHAETKTTSCAFDLTLPASKEPFVEVGDVACHPEPRGDKAAR